jgi:hypothetical protein
MAPDLNNPGMTPQQALRTIEACLQEHGIPYDIEGLPLTVAISALWDLALIGKRTQ